jgi:type 1 fimbria pilin
MNAKTFTLVTPSLLIALSLPPMVATASQGWGQVNMEGAIVDSACAIDIGSRDQTIEMDMLPLGHLVRENIGPINPFSIRLINCTLSRPTPGKPDWCAFQVTFAGATDGELFTLEGEASGLALQITDHAGNIAIPGVPMLEQAIQPGTFDLNYTLRLVGNQQILRAGEYRSAIRYKMDYY